MLEPGGLQVKQCEKPQFPKQNLKFRKNIGTGSEKRLPETKIEVE